MTIQIRNSYQFLLIRKKTVLSKNRVLFWKYHMLLMFLNFFVLITTRSWNITMKLFLSMFNIVASYLFQYRRRIFECRTRNFYKSSDGNPATAQAGMSGWCCSTSGSASKHNLDNKCQSFYTGLSSQVRNYTEIHKDSKCFEGVAEIKIGDLFVLEDLDGIVLNRDLWR